MLEEIYVFAYTGGKTSKKVCQKFYFVSSSSYGDTITCFLQIKSAVIYNAIKKYRKNGSENWYVTLAFYTDIK